MKKDVKLSEKDLVELVRNDRVSELVENLFVCSHEVKDVSVKNYSEFEVEYDDCKYKIKFSFDEMRDYGSWKFESLRRKAKS